MIYVKFFILTAALATALSSGSAVAEILNQETFKTHLRWNLAVPKDQIFINKKDQVLRIETVDLKIYDALAVELTKLKANGDYVERIGFSKENFPEKPAVITVALKDPSVELFSFYREGDKKYILDFWINTDHVQEKAAALQKPLPLPTQTRASVKKSRVAKAAPDTELTKNQLLIQKSPLIPVVSALDTGQGRDAVAGYRDFRYGASFIWSYDPMIPQLERDVNLAAKIPDALYPIRDREKLDDPKEAHLQLSINFYREAKWGLMNKSITLYEKKYGRHDANRVLNEFMKANALLRDNITKPNRGITQSAMVILTNIKDLTEDYALKTAILRYLLQYNLDMKDHVKVLELAKQLFVLARGEFDQTMVIQASLTVLHALAELKQITKIEEFLSDKKLTSILPPQMGLAYITYAMLSKGATKDLLKRYEAVEKSLVKPVHPAILFNVAESYFRHANYERAISVYDEFVASYAYLLRAPEARLRLALSFELLERPVAQNLLLYKNAIDRSTSPEARYEAKLRYVAFRLARKLRASEEDRESEVFLEQSPDETKALTQDLKKLLWLVRLRIFITAGEFDKALSYLSTVPLDSLKAVDRRVFEADGAEVVFGLIQSAYLEEDYSKVVKLWEVYKDKYEAKTGKNPYMNFVVCDSYLRLGLHKSYDRALADFKRVSAQPSRSFPIWVPRVKNTDLTQLSEELTILRLLAAKDWDSADAKLASLSVSLRDSMNYAYYRGIIRYQQKKYRDAVAEFEKVLVNTDPRNQLTPRQTAELLMGYVDSLYRLKDQQRFKTIVRALYQDIRRSKSAPILNVSERINYLLIESYAGEATPEWKELEMMTKDFQDKFQKSPYTARVGYLYALSLVKNQKVQEGKEVLRLMANDKDVPVHIKEMCRSELATLELAEKRL